MVALLSLRGSTAYFLRLWAWERERRGKRGGGVFVVRNDDDGMGEG